MLPVSLIFTSGAASGVNSYAAVLVLGLLGRFAHIAAIPPVLEHPLVLAAAAVLYAGQFVVGKVPLLDSVWDVVHTTLRPVIGGAIGLAHPLPSPAQSQVSTYAPGLSGCGGAKWPATWTFWGCDPLAHSFWGCGPLPRTQTAHDPRAPFCQSQRGVRGMIPKTLCNFAHF